MHHDSSTQGGSWSSEPAFVRGEDDETYNYGFLSCKAEGFMELMLCILIELWGGWFSEGVNIASGK